MEVLEILQLISDKLPDVDLAQLALEIENRQNGYSVLALSIDGYGTMADLLNFLSQFKEEKDMVIDMGKNVAAYLLAHKSLDEYRSASDFAKRLSLSIAEELHIKVKIGIGEFSSGSGMSAINSGLSALASGQFFDSKKSVFTFKEFMLVKFLREVPKEQVKLFMDVMTEGETAKLLNDPEIVETAEGFFDASLNLAETSRRLFLHRNTLLYRLDKIEEITGLNIRIFSDALIFRLMILFHKLR